MKPNISRSIVIGVVMVLICNLSLLGFVTGFQPGNIRAWWGSMGQILPDFRSSFGLVEAEDLLEYLAENRDDMSLVAFSLSPEGEPRWDEAALRVNETQAMPLAGLEQVLVLAAYAQAVELGQLDPEEPVLLADWDRYHLPNADEGAHNQALKRLNLAPSPLGFAENSQQSVPLREIPWAMIRYNDASAMSYLLTRLDADALAQVSQTAGLSEAPQIWSPLALALLWRNHEFATQNTEQAETLLALPAETARTRAEALVQQYLSDSAWRQAEIDWRGGGGRVSNLAYESQLVDHFLPQGQAMDYAQLLGQIASQQFISPAVSDTMLTYLTWPMEAPELQGAFSLVGNKGGFRAGILSDSAFFVPSIGDYQGETRVTVLLVQNMPVPAQIKLRQTFAHQKLLIALATEASFVDQVRAGLQE